MSQTPDRADRVEVALEVVVIVAALATIPLTVAQMRQMEGPGITVADWAVWSVFVVEYAAMMARTRERWLYTRRNWLNVAVIVLSFPLLPELMALTRLVRLVRLTRLFRLLRLVGVSARAIQALKRSLGHRGLIYVAALVAVLVVGGGAALSVLEPESVDGFGSGLWWGVVTATTVGYGDIAPVTATGRIIAAFLMLAGVGLVATLAASIAAYFVGEDETTNLERRLDHIESLLVQIQEQIRTLTDEKPAGPSPSDV